MTDLYFLERLAKKNVMELYQYGCIDKQEYQEMMADVEKQFFDKSASQQKQGDSNE